MSKSDTNPVDPITDEFIQRLRRGEHPSITEYAERFPELAEELREVLPSVALMEQLRQEQSDPSEAADDVPSAEVPDRIGDYQIVREIGRGGMGVVYEARQESLGRHVALKVLPAGLLTISRNLSRFQREARAAARLHHTNIVPVFGVGKQDGTHYYVMQYIRGKGLDQWIGDQVSSHAQLDTMSGRQANTPERSGTAPRDSTIAQPSETPKVDHLPGPTETVIQPFDDEESGSPAPEIRDRKQQQRGPATEGPAISPQSESTPGSSTIEMPTIRRTLTRNEWIMIADLIRQVATGLNYAHEHGVLHRDIKPANLLLDGENNVWIADFGLAKLGEQDDLTRSGDIVGTLRYMAPEQFNGRVDARSDLYSLGLTLYELVTLKPAFDELNQSRLIRQVTLEDPVPPRKLNPQIPPDLETIILKTIAREPERRYATGAELAADLSNFIEDRPILARRSTPIERLGRWCRRNPPLAALSATVLSLLLVIAIGATIGYFKATRQRDRIMTEQKRAEDNLQLALQAFEEMFTQLSTVPAQRFEDSSGMLDDVDSNAPLLPAEVTNRDAKLLERLLDFYGQFAERNRMNPELTATIADANYRIGQIHERLGHANEAELAYQQAEQTYAKLAEESREERVPIVVSRARALNGLGKLQFLERNATEAIKHYQQAITVLESIPVAGRSNEARFELVRANSFLAEALIHDRRAAAAQKHVTRAEELIVPLTKTHPNRADYLYAQAQIAGHRFLLHAARREPIPSLESKDEAIRLLNRLVDDYPEIPEYTYDLAVLLAITPQRSFGNSYRDRFSKALNRALELATQLSRKFPEVIQYQGLKAQLQLRLASMAMKDGDNDNARQQMTEAMGELAEVANRAPDVRPVLADARFRAARMHLGKKEFAEARKLLEGALKTLSKNPDSPRQSSMRRVFGGDYRTRLKSMILNSLGEALRGLNETTLAEEAFEESRQLASQLRAPGPGGRGRHDRPQPGTSGGFRPPFGARPGDNRPFERRSGQPEFPPARRPGPPGSGRPPGRLPGDRPGPPQQQIPPNSNPSRSGDGPEQPGTAP